MGIMHLFILSAPHSPLLHHDSVVQVLTLVANRKLVIVSFKCASSGLTMTNMNVLEFPPSEYCSRCVNLELRYGTWPDPRPSASMTSPRHARLLLIFCVSFIRSPSA